MKSMKKYIIPLIALTALTGWGCEEEMSAAIGTTKMQ